MRSFFNVDNIIFKGISRIGDLFILSFFWVITGIGLITIGASTTALLSTTIKILRKRDINIARDFFTAFKSNFRQSTIIWLIMLVLGAVLYADVYFWSNLGGDLAMLAGALSAGLCIIYLAVLVYVFAVQAVFENTIPATFRTAFFMALHNWKTSIALLLSMGGISYACWVFPVALFIMLVFGNACLALIFSVRYLTIFRLYSDALKPDEDLVEQ